MVITQTKPVLRARECSCRTLGRYRRNLQRSGLASLAERYTLERFEEAELWQQRMKKAALLYLEEGCKEKRWFYLSGRPGCGKTHLCTALCTALAAQGLELQYFKWIDGSLMLKSLVGDRAAYELAERPLLRCGALYIDDFFKLRPSEADLRLAMELVGRRYDEEKITIFSSERSLESLRKLDPALAGRIRERCGLFALSADGEGRDRRFAG